MMYLNRLSTTQVTGTLGVTTVYTKDLFIYFTLILVHPIALERTTLAFAKQTLTLASSKFDFFHNLSSFCKLSATLISNMCATKT